LGSVETERPANYEHEDEEDGGTLAGNICGSEKLRLQSTFADEIDDYQAQTY
jgi:hypothetical protein